MNRTIKVRKNSNGIWCCRLYLGRNLNGKIIQPYASFPAAKTQKEAEELASMWASHITSDGKVKSTQLTDLLLEYVSIKRRNGASPNTTRQHEGFIRNHINGRLGKEDVRSVTSSLLTSFEQDLLKKGLSRNSVINLHQFLRGAYNYFVSAGICDYNPLINVAKPSREVHEAVSIEEWGFAGISTLINSRITTAIQENEFNSRVVCAFAAWLSLVTGMRCGEVCAIRYSDVNMLYKHIHVSGTVIEESYRKPYRRESTKGKRSRNIAITDSDISFISDYMKLQKAHIAFVESSTPLISLDGSYMRPTSVSRSFTRMRRTLQLPQGITFHSLRHTHASWCLASGVDLKTLSERLGHADPATTLRIYSHLLPGRDRGAAEAFGDALRTIEQRDF